MNVLVTGASGFLGGAVVRDLRARGHRVRALVRGTSDTSDLDGVALYKGDLDVPMSLLAAVDGVEAVVHAAARVDDAGSREAFEKTNVRGTEALLRAARRAGVRRLVFVSSPSVVMDGRPKVRQSPRARYPRRFLNLYSETKARAERAVLAADTDGFRTLALRPRGIYGPGDTTGPIARILDRLEAGRLPDLSGPRPVYADLCFVDSAARACSLAVEADVGGQAWFVTDDDPIDVWRTVRDLAARLEAPDPSPRVPPLVGRGLGRALDAAYRLPGLQERSPPLSRYAVTLLTKTHTYDLEPTRRDLGYAPVASFAEGLEAMLAWRRSG